MTVTDGRNSELLSFMLCLTQVDPVWNSLISLQLTALVVLVTLSRYRSCTLPKALNELPNY